MEIFSKAALGAVAASLLFCGMTFAAQSHSINLLYPAQIGNHLKLKPGNYNLRVSRSPKPEAAFYQHGKLVGQAPVKLVSEAQKNSQTQIDYSSPSGNFRRITQIQFSGWRDKLVFKSS